MTPLLVGGIVEAVGKIADNLFTSDKERLDAELDLRKIGIEAAKIDASLLTGQQEINKTEALHSSVFVAGSSAGTQPIACIQPQPHTNNG